jgi:hypothetical protein
MKLLSSVKKKLGNKMGKALRSAKSAAAKASSKAVKRLAAPKAAPSASTMKLWSSVKKKISNKMDKAMRSAKSVATKAPSKAPAPSIAAPKAPEPSVSTTKLWSSIKKKFSNKMEKAKSAAPKAPKAAAPSFAAPKAAAPSFASPKAAVPSFAAPKAAAPSFAAPKAAAPSFAAPKAAAPSFAAPKAAAPSIAAPKAAAPSIAAPKAASIASKLDPFKKVASDFGKNMSKTFSKANLSGFANRTMGIRKILVALLFIGIIVAIVMVAIYFARVRYPRPIYLNAAKDIDDIMRDIYIQMNEFANLASRVQEFAPVSVPKTVAFIESNIVVQPNNSRQQLATKGMVLGGCGSREQGSILNFSEEKKTQSQQLTPPKMPQHTETPFEVYLKHENLMNGWDQVIYKDILKHYRQYSECASDNSAGETVVRAVVNQVREVQAELIAAVQAVEKYETDGIEEGEANAELITEYCVGVHMMYFYLYESTKNLKEMYDSRRWSMFNFLKVTINPMVENILEKEIKSRWIEVTMKSTITERREEFDRLWKKLDESITNAPSKLLDIISAM